VINRAYESQLQSRSRRFSLSDVENVRGQPRSDGARVAAVRVPALLGDATLLRALRGGSVGTLASAGEMRSTRNDLELWVSGGSILGRRESLLAGRRHLVDALLPLVTRRPLGTRLMTSRHIPR